MAKTDEEIVLEISADIGNLKADLANAKKSIKGFEKQFEKAGKEVQSFEKKVDKAGKGFKGTSDGMLLGIKRLRADIGAFTFAVGAMTAGILAITKTQVDAARETARWAKMLDVGADSLSALSVVGQKFNVSLDDVASGLNDMSLKITDAANGAKPFEEVLGKIGLKSADLVKLKPDEQFLKLADAISEADSELQRFALDELGSDPLLRMIGLLQEGSTGIKGMMKEVTNLGLSISAVEFEQLEALSASLIDANIQLNAAGKLLTISLGPALTTVLELTELTFKGWTKMVNAITGGPDFSIASSGMDSLKSEATRLREELVELEKTKVLEEGRSFFGIDASRVQYLEGINLQLAGTSIELGNVTNRINELKGAQNKTVRKEEEEQDSTRKATELEAANKHAENIALSHQLAADLRQQIVAQEIIAEAGEHATKMELEQTRRDDKLSSLFETALLEGEAKELARTMEEQAQQDFMDREFGGAKRQADRMGKLWKSGLDGKLKVASSMAGQLSSLMHSENRKQFEIGKAAAIAQATISTYEAAVINYAQGSKIGGPPVGAAFAAVSVAAGLLQIQKISSTTMGGGSAGASAGASASGATAQAEQAAPENVIDASFNITGQSVGTDQVRSMLGGLNELLEDGGKLRTITMI